MDLERFRKAKLTRPTAEIALPELTGFLFDEGEKPVLLVRGLTSNENWLAREQKDLNSYLKTFKETFDKALGGQFQELQQEVSKLTGGTIENRTAEQMAYFIEVVLRGTITPDNKPLFRRQDVVRLADHFPLQFSALHQQILSLTGDPSNLGELKNGSGVSPPSGTP